MKYNHRGFPIMFVLLLVLITFILINLGKSSESVDIELQMINEDQSEDDILKEMLDIQRLEEEELVHQEMQIANDELEAKESERIAIEKEKEQIEEQRIKQQREYQMNKNKQKEIENQRKSNNHNKKSKAASSNTLKAAKTNTDYTSEEIKSRDNHRIPHNYPNSNTNSGSSGGSYYGTQQQHKKKQSHEIDHNSSRMNQKSNDMIHNLESKLSENLQSKANQDILLKEQDEYDKKQRYERYSIKRSYAYPVETIIKIYDNENTDLYQVLGVNRNVDDGYLKRLYRAKALSIHPDKNPHPDTKIAFDALQDAYDTLSSPSKRTTYDLQVQKIRNVRRFKLRKSYKWLVDTYTNIKSEIQLLISQINKKESIQIIENMIEYIHTNIYQSFIHMLEHFVLLPTFKDRILLFHEIIWNHKKIFVIIPVISSIIIT